MARITVKQGDIETPTEIIADSIVEISKGMKAMRSGRLNDKAVVILLSHSCQVSQRDIKLVLDALDNLSATYLRKKT